MSGYRFAPVEMPVPDDPVLDKLVLVARRRWPQAHRDGGEVGWMIETLLDWLDEDEANPDRQDVINAANALAYRLRRRRPVVAYPIGAHPDDGEPFAGIWLPSFEQNAKRWAYRAWLAELDQDEARRVGKQLVADFFTPVTVSTATLARLHTNVERADEAASAARDERAAEIKRLIKAGATLRTIADALGVSPPAVHKIANR